jgi:hypothetical protein
MAAVLAGERSILFWGFSVKERRSQSAFDLSILGTRMTREKFNGMRF